MRLFTNDNIGPNNNPMRSRKNAAQAENLLVEQHLDAAPAAFFSATAKVNISSPLVRHYNVAEETQAAIMLLQLGQARQQKSVTSSDRKDRILEALFTKRTETIALLNLWCGLLSILQRMSPYIYTELGCPSKRHKVYCICNRPDDGVGFLLRTLEDHVMGDIMEEDRSHMNIENSEAAAIITRAVRGQRALLFEFLTQKKCCSSRNLLVEQHLDAAPAAFFSATAKVNISSPLVRHYNVAEETQAAIMLLQLGQARQQKSVTSSDRKDRILEALFTKRTETIALLNLWRRLLSILQRMSPYIYTELGCPSKRHKVYCICNRPDDGVGFLLRTLEDHVMGDIMEEDRSHMNIENSEAAAIITRAVRGQRALLFEFLTL
ncbi:hypothetical protein DPMN_014099 [Dreissena polymorpha]|uniref:Uncharacterized protein n=1 Tax=Dreissena polymorpha TaxID=45954 RepID=A0A9D4N8J9_DREPO|nr:hypothetical protein DPMN_014099 [Dreissena polymorpha]